MNCNLTPMSIATIGNAKFCAKFSRFAKFFGSEKLQVYTSSMNLHYFLAQKMQSEKLAFVQV